MISLETCKKLYHLGIIFDYQQQEMFEITEDEDNSDYGYKCLPRLDQLLDEIYKQGYGLHLSKFGESNCFTIWEDECRFDKTDDTEHNFDAGSPSEAVAQALLWILEQRRQKDE